MKIKFKIGDSSGDGHGRAKDVYVETGKSGESGVEYSDKHILEMTKTLARKHLIDFSKLCSAYEDFTIKGAVLDKLVEHGIITEEEDGEIDEDMLYVQGADHFVGIWMRALKLVDDRFSAEIVQEQFPTIDGFGYGLFN